jgi:hypothetical protein
MRSLLERTLDMAHYLNVSNDKISELYFTIRSDLAHPEPTDIRANLLCQRIAMREVYITFESALMDYMHITPPNLSELKGIKKEERKPWYERFNE